MHVRETLNSVLEFLSGELKSEAMAAYTVRDSPGAYAVFKKRAENFEAAISLLKYFGEAMEAVDDDASVGYS